MKVFLPSPCSAPAKYGGSLQAGWQDIETAYAKQLLSVGQALDQKGHEALSKQQAAAEKASQEYRAKRIKERNLSRGITISKSPTSKRKPQNPKSNSKYEKSSKVG